MRGTAHMPGSLHLGHVASVCQDLQGTGGNSECFCGSSGTSIRESFKNTLGCCLLFMVMTARELVNSPLSRLLMCWVGRPGPQPHRPGTGWAPGIWTHKTSLY